jgi:hypothetical protein
MLRASAIWSCWSGVAVSGRHVTEVALPSRPPAPKYSMLVMSAYIPTRLTSRVHYHSGVEAFYTVDGEQCL